MLLESLKIKSNLLVNVVAVEHNDEAYLLKSMANDIVTPYGEPASHSDILIDRPVNLIASNIVKEQYKQIQKIYTSRVKELELKLKSLSDKQMSMERKRNFDLEGYKNEMKLIRQRVKSFEDYVNKLRKMTHGTTDRSGDINSYMNDNNNNANFSGDLNNFKVIYS